MPQEACRDIAFKLVELAELDPDDLLLDVGAGTGELGSEIARLRPRYVGLDLSRPMLRVFQRRLERSPAPATLLIADANGPWPISDRCVRAIFGSRSLHLVSADRVTREAFRVASSRGALLVVGRVRRDPHSVSARMRREMLRLLEKNGGERDGESRSRLLIQALVAHGGAAFDPVVAARWTATHRPSDSLRIWKSKPGLGSMDTLSKLEKWAKEAFDSLDTRFESNEEYVLEGVRLPAR